MNLLMRTVAKSSLLCLLPAAAALSLQAAPDSGVPLDFVHQIAPVLKEHCGGCHMGDKKKGAFSMNTSASLRAGSENGKVLDPSAPHKSVLLEVLFSSDPDKAMPPPAKDRARPTPAQLELLRRWVLAGAPWEAGFVFQKTSYQAPVKPRLPVLPPDSPGMEHPLDRLLSTYYAKHGVPPPKLADDTSFARRIYLDLLGVLPLPQALDEFVNDKTPDKRTRLIDALLERRTEYAEHWLTFWNDLLRNDYGGTGFITGGRKQISNWLYQSLISNQPYDQMVREIVNPSPETEGFAQGITWRGTVSASQTREVQFSQSISQSFLGINMKCASCHDSFVDHWKLTDAYGLAAIYAENSIEIARCEKATGKMAIPSWPFPELGQINPEAPRADRLKQLAHLMTHPDNGWFARTIVNRFWAALLGRGLVHPVDAMGTEPWSEEVLDYLGWDLAQQGFNLKSTLRLITTSLAYQAETVSRVKDDATAPFVFRGPRARRMTAEQFIDNVWQITGTSPKGWDAPVRRGEPLLGLLESREWNAQWISASTPTPEPGSKESKGRVTVLKKVVSLPTKPTRAAGILAGSGDLRLFINGTEVKAPHLLHFGKTSEVKFDGMFVAGENTLTVVAPAKPGKTEAQMALLALDLRLNGDTVQTIISDATWEVSSSFTEAMLKEGKLAPKAPEFKAGVWSPASVTAEPAIGGLDTLQLRREMVWANQPAPPARASLLKADLLMRTLGRPNRDQIVTNRPQDLSTLEALDLSAGARLNEILSAGAKQVASQKFASASELVDWLYLRALCRKALPEERSAALEMLGEKPTPQMLEDFLWAVFVLPEFQLVR